MVSTSGKESACQCKRHSFNPWVWKISWRRDFPVQGSLAGCSPWGCKGLDMTKHAHTHAHTHTHTHTHTSSGEWVSCIILEGPPRVVAPKAGDSWSSPMSLPEVCGKGRCKPYHTGLFPRNTNSPPPPPVPTFQEKTLSYDVAIFIPETHYSCDPWGNAFQNKFPQVLLILKYCRISSLRKCLSGEFDSQTP